MKTEKISKERSADLIAKDEWIQVGESTNGGVFWNTITGQLLSDCGNRSGNHELETPSGLSPRPNPNVILLIFIGLIILLWCFGMFIAPFVL